ncbi:class F sortase [Leifsonia xyli]|uniref:class F sortase n=1 Tax=Leifsonia xyli TaxID=1575 RepID=UPI0007D09CC1
MSTRRTTTGAPSRRRRAWPQLLAGVALILAAVGVMTLVLTPHGTAEGTVDLRGNPVSTDDATLSPEAVAAAAPEPVAGVRFAVPSVGLDVAMEELTATAADIEPPGFTSVYHLRNHGTALDKPEAGTLFLLTHSIRGGGLAPGNALIDVKNQRSAVSIGATISVGADTYRVTGTEVISKPDLAHRSDVWSDTPGRLVLITCLQNPQGTPSQNNLVLTAQLEQ